MFEFERSRIFADWLNSLRDTIGKARIIARLRASEHGNFGDCESVGAAFMKCVFITALATGCTSLAKMK